MDEINVFYLNKPKLNTGRIVFDNCKQSKKMVKLLEKMHVPYFKSVLIKDGHKYFSFKVWNISRRLLEFMACIREVMDEPLYSNYISNDINSCVEFSDNSSP